ncbi:MAG: hypothetical protein R3C19_06430 [Planctomycetaceae bacterium]
MQLIRPATFSTCCRPRRIFSGCRLAYVAGFLLFSSVANGGLVSFSDGSSSGTGTVDGRIFTWTAVPDGSNADVVNPVREVLGDGSTRSLDWGIGGDVSVASSRDFTITMTLPESWQFNAVSFTGLNEVADRSIFSVQMFDASGEAIDLSSLTADTTSGFGSDPWSYDVADDFWNYATIGGSTTPHTATLNGSIAGVRQLVFDIDASYGRDFLRNLDLTAVPEPTATAPMIMAFGLLFLAAGGRRRLHNFLQRDSFRAHGQSDLPAAPWNIRQLKFVAHSEIRRGTSSGLAS